MQQDELKILLRKFFENKADPSEIQRLLTYFDNCDDLDQDIDSLSMVEQIGVSAELGAERKALVYENLTRHLTERQPRVVRLFHKFPRSIAAAIIFFLLGIGYIFWANWAGIGRVNVEEDALLANDIVLPDTGALLITTVDGSDLRLDPTNKSDVLALNNFQVYSTGDGTIICELPAELGDRSASTPTIFSTQKGRSVKMLLPDQTIVWLNANSKLHLAPSYNTTDRRVAIEGEAYFEVSHDRERPFIVTAKSSQIEVLGTQFNVTNYAGDTRVTTTLVEGSVAMASRGNTVTLRKGEQAIALDDENSEIAVRQVKTDAYTSWKEGYFTFDHERISQILDRIDDWYDIKAVDIPTYADVEISGTFERTKKLSEFLRVLEKITDLKFSIKEGRVYVR